MKIRNAAKPHDIRFAGSAERAGKPPKTAPDSINGKTIARYPAKGSGSKNGPDARCAAGSGAPQSSGTIVQRILPFHVAHWIKPTIAMTSPDTRTAINVIRVNSIPPLESPWDPAG